jgi:Co/Zn/Cd efflux system component
MYVLQYSSWERRGIADPIASLVIVAIIVIGTMPLLKHATNILLQKVPLHIDLAALRESVEAVSGVLAVHDFHCWQLDNEKVRSYVSWDASLCMLKSTSEHCRLLRPCT